MRAGEVARSFRRRGKNIVLVSGSYDIPHLGHAFFFEHARKKGDVLFVSVGSDKNIRTLKGVTWPVLPQKLRGLTVAAYQAVDYVVLEREDMLMPGKVNFAKLVQLIRPNVFVVNSTDSAIREKREFLKKFGVRLAIIDVTKGPDVSTSKIIALVRAKTVGKQRL